MKAILSPLQSQLLLLTGSPTTIWMKSSRKKQTARSSLTKLYSQLALENPVGVLYGSG